MNAASELSISAHEDRAAYPHHTIIAVSGVQGWERQPDQGPERQPEAVGAAAGSGGSGSRIRG